MGEKQNRPFTSLSVLRSSLTFRELDEAGEARTAANRLASPPTTLFLPRHLPQQRYNCHEPESKRRVRPSVKAKDVVHEANQEAEVKHDTRIKVELECSAANSQDKKPV